MRMRGVTVATHSMCVYPPLIIFNSVYVQHLKLHAFFTQSLSHGFCWEVY